MLCLLAILLGACAGWALVANRSQSQNKSLSTAMEGNFPRPNYFKLFVTPEMGEYVQLLYSPVPNGVKVIYTSINFENGQWIYTWPSGNRTIMPTEYPIEIFWAIDKKGDLVEAMVWVDEYGVWIDMRLFDESSDI